MIDRGAATPASGVERLRSGLAPLLLYPILALFSFPTFGAIVAREDGLAYSHDVFDIPRSGVGADWLANGVSLWNVHVTAGNALLAQQAISPFAIDVPLGLVVGPFTAYAVVAWLLAVVAGISMHLFLRDSLRLSTVAVVGGATMFLFSFWHYSIGFSALAAPMLLWLADGAARSSPGRWRFVAGHVILGAFILYNGQSQIVIILAAIELAYVIWAHRADALGFRGPLGTWFLSWVLAFALYGPVLLTQLVALPLSQRTIWDLDYLYDARPLEALRGAVTFYSASLFGDPVAGGLGMSPAVYGTFFLGVLGLPFLVLGVVSGGRDARRRFLLALLLAIPLLDLVAVVATPIQAQLGFLASFQFVRVRHLLPFALVVGAAIGLDLFGGQILNGRPFIPAERWRRALIALTLVPPGIGAVVAVGQVLARRRELLRLDSHAIGWALAAVAIAGGLVVIVVVSLALSRAGPRMAFAGARVLAALLIVLAGERATYGYAERLMGSEISTWSSQLGLTPAVRFLLAQPGIGVDRVLSFGDNPSRLGAAGLLQADGYETIYPLTYHAYFGALLGPQLAVDPKSASYYYGWGNRAITFGPRVDPELVALVGARWLYVEADGVPTIPGIVPRYHDADVTVYEVPNVLPRAFIVGRYDALPDPAAVVNRLATASLNDLRESVFVADGPDERILRAGLAATSGASNVGGGAAGTSGTAAITTYQPDRVEIDVEAPGPGILVLTDVVAQGWSAERDGTHVPIAAVDGTFRGIAVGANTRKVILRYAPAFTYIGFGIAGMAALAALLCVVLVRRRDRRTPG